MTSPDPTASALAAAMRPPDGLRARPDAGALLRVQAERRQARRTAAGLTGALAVVALVVLTVGTLVDGGALPVPPAGNAMMRQGPPTGPVQTSPGAVLGVKYGPSGLGHPIKVVPVRSTRPAPCVASPSGPAGASIIQAQRICYQLASNAVLVIKQVTSLQVYQGGSADAPSVQLTLDATDTATFRWYTRRNIGSQIAFVVAGRIWSAPEIAGATDTGRIEIVGGFTAGEADLLVDSLGVRMVSRPPGMRVG